MNAVDPGGIPIKFIKGNNIFSYNEMMYTSYSDVYFQYNIFSRLSERVFRSL